MGRNTLLTKELQDSICQSIRDGLYIYRACQLHGVSKDSYFRWLKQGEAGEYPFSDFYDAVKKAEAEDIEARIKEARSFGADRKSWEQVFRYLESRYPSEYGKKLAVQHSDQQEALQRIKDYINVLTNPQPQIIEGQVKELTEAK